jgi:uncharacterized protein (DUF4213/DUF364 family)
MNEPLSHFFEKYGMDVSDIKKIICGAKYSAVLLKNGNIGVCANLLNEKEVGVGDIKNPDLSQFGHRIIINAYFNGILNHSNQYPGKGDIFRRVDFNSYKDLVMIGLFKPLLEKLIQNHISVRTFDMIKKDPDLMSEEKKREYVRKADAIILSATTIANNTFLDIVNSTGENCDIFLLGPSSILDSDMLEFKNIKRIFGSIFRLNDQRVLDAIQKGYGTRKFLPFGQKVYL